MAPIREGRVNTTLCHLGNMAYRTGAELCCEPAKGKPEAAAAVKLWSREYEPGWEVVA